MTDVIAYVRRDHMEVVNLQDGARAEGSGYFTTTRLLVGEFPGAEALLTKLVKEVKGSGFFRAQPRMLLQPLEMTEGGLSAVEERVFTELGLGAGARFVKLHVGPRLDPQAALELLDAPASSGS